MKATSLRKDQCMIAVESLVDLGNAEWRDLTFLRRAHDRAEATDDREVCAEILETMAEIIWPYKFVGKLRKGPLPPYKRKALKRC